MSFIHLKGLKAMLWIKQNLWNISRGYGYRPKLAGMCILKLHSNTTLTHTFCHFYIFCYYYYLGLKTFNYTKLYNHAGVSYPLKQKNSHQRAFRTLLIWLISASTRQAASAPAITTRVFKPRRLAPDLRTRQLMTASHKCDYLNALIRIPTRVI